VCGARGRTPCLTLHDVGLDHRSCWQGLLLAAGPQSLLNKNFCFYHVDAPGCQVRWALSWKQHWWCQQRQRRQRQR
jgi:hypothetical protein